MLHKYKSHTGAKLKKMNIHPSICTYVHEHTLYSSITTSSLLRVIEYLGRGNTEVGDPRASLSLFGTLLHACKHIHKNKMMLPICFNKSLREYSNCVQCGEATLLADDIWAIYGRGSPAFGLGIISPCIKVPGHCFALSDTKCEEITISVSTSVAMLQVLPCYRCCHARSVAMLQVCYTTQESGL